MESKHLQPTSLITLRGGTYEMSTEFTQGVDEFNNIRITKISDPIIRIPSHSFIERLKYLFTGKLRGVEVLAEYRGEE